jgi:putative transposase
MRIIEPLEAGGIYHIFNRGINSEPIFKERRNYYYFLKKYEEYCSNILETYAYALLNNHFHFLVKVKENIIETRRNGQGKVEISATKQLSHFFNSYVQSYNKAFSRHGKLLEEPFKRKIVGSESYFTSLIYYIHFNPQQHKIVNDFRQWEFTSWNNILSDKQTFVTKEKVIDWFGTIENFKNSHLNKMNSNDISHLLIE